MHDYHAVSALIAYLAADPDLVNGVVEVKVEAGAGFSPEALGQAYDMLTEGTWLEGSRLVVYELAEPRECLACGSNWTLTSGDVIGHLVVCPSCGMVTPVGGTPGIKLVEVIKKLQPFR